MSSHRDTYIKHMHTLVMFEALDTSTQGWIVMLDTMYAGLLSCTEVHYYDNSSLHLLSSCCTQHLSMSCW